MFDAINNALLGYWTADEIAINVNIFLNIAGALLLGLMVGYERSYRGRAAGMRTYGLVCMASCALTVITATPNHWYAGHLPAVINAVDPGRIIQGITTGVGFLGAGVIMRDGLNISGLTTAASIWTVAAIGVLVGVGFYSAAILLAVLSTFFMMWGAKIESFLPSRHAVAVNLHFKKDADLSEKDLSKLIHSQGYEVAKGSFSITQRGGESEWRFVAVSMGKRKGASLAKLGESLTRAPGVQDFQIAHARN
ncbi:MAG: MgtC/SapB family protein [Alphaproteobacteria bacterium]|nr:MgtC/SapB family protein [Alphaproteobacteria bacterium]